MCATLCSSSRAGNNYILIIYFGVGTLKLEIDVEITVQTYEPGATYLSELRSAAYLVQLCVPVPNTNCPRIISLDRRSKSKGMGDIWQAARANNVKRVKALLDEGTSPDATRWSGVTPLHRAAEVNSCQVAQVLINSGASVNARAAWGWYAPLHLALLNGHELVAELLLRAGARWTILTKRLQSPYDLAVSRGLKIQALRIQEISRKIAEERRILQKTNPTDATTTRSRNKRSVAAAGRKQVLHQQKHQQHQQQQRQLTDATDDEQRRQSTPPRDGGQSDAIPQGANAIASIAESQEDNEENEEEKEEAGG